MLEQLAREICGTGFFEGWLEYPWLPGEREIYTKHKVHIEAHEESCRETMFEFAEALMLKYWPKVRGMGFTEGDLSLKGLPPSEPDIADFV